MDERIGITGMQGTEENKLEGDLQELDNTITTLTNNFLNSSLFYLIWFQAKH